MLVGLLVHVRHPVGSIAHLTIGISFYFEFLREVSHCGIMPLRHPDAISGARALGGSGAILIQLKMAEI